MYPLLIAGFFMSIMKASAQAGFWDSRPGGCQALNG